MAKWVHADTLDNGIAHIKANATKMILISAYSVGDSYNTVISNTLATVDMTSGDYTITTKGTNRLIATTPKIVTASASSSTPDLHIAFTDGASKVLWVTDEASNQAIVAGNSVNFPSIVYTVNRPT